VDEVWIVPCRNHAFSKSLESAEHRVKMIELATRGIKGVKISDVEIKSRGKNYTLNTVRKLRKKYPKNEFFLIIGSDILKEITKWHKYETLLEEIDIFVFKRSKKDISSTQIRKSLGKKNKITELVPKSVEEYITQRGLYQENEEIEDD